MKAVTLLTAATLVLALVSIVLTRGFRLFELAELCAVASLLAGIAMYLAHRRSANGAPLAWPGRLILAGSALGIGGLLLKGLFLLLGLGAGQHDMATHVTTPGNPLLVHVHHLFFNLAFVLFAVAATGLALRAMRREYRNRRAARCT